MTEDVEARFLAALALHEAADLAAAKAAYQQILAAAPNHSQTLINLANLLAAEGAMEEAFDYARRALYLAPDEPLALKCAGMLELNGGDLAEAERLLSAALACNRTDAEVAFYLGTIAQTRGANHTAVEYYRLASEVTPDIAEIHNNLGNALLALGRVAEAADALSRALDLRPDFAAAWNSLGNLHDVLDEYEVAMADYTTALKHDPSLPAAWLNRAQLRIEIGDHELAENEIVAYLEAHPDDAAGHNALGLVYQRAARHDQAITAFRRALELREGYLQAVTNLAISTMALGRHEEAVEFYRAAADLAPDRPEPHANLGHIYQTLGRHRESEEAFRRVLEIDTGAEQVLPFLAHALMYLCDWNDLDAVLQKALDSLKRRQANGETVSAPPFGIAGTPASPELRLAVARAVSGEIEQAMKGLALPPPPITPRSESGPIRIGYVSPDFREHSLGMVFQGLLSAHSHEDFVWFGYSVSPRPDLSFASYEREFDGFVDLAQFSFAESVERIREDRIDILIDLAGHTRDSALDLFALRPAPVQVHYLGYGATLGADFIDYLVTDRVHTPASLAPYCSESLIYLPHSFMAATPAEVATTRYSRGQCGLPEEAVVFACFNAHYKIDPTIFAVWMRLLERVPGSVLWLREGSSTATRNLRDAAISYSVDPERLVFAERLDRPEHLARHCLADLVLDTRFHVGGVTTVDALWSGVPVITVAGPSHSMRTGTSMLSAIDMPQLIASDLETYESLALDLANDSERRAQIRAELDAKRLSEPLFDPQQLAHNLEIAYRRIWRRYQAGEAPSDLHLDPLDG